jgi:predicted lipoprotein with Yx(FWY)xxD motif
MRNFKAVAVSLGATAVIAAALGSAFPATSATVSSTSVAARSSATSSVSSMVLRVRKIGSVTLVTNSKGRTVYSFAPDTSSKSNCNGSCAQLWPPVKGPAKAGPGVTGKLGTIKRSDGSTQATYNGHPLYTYVGDAKPGQATGNNLNLSGGVWHEVPVTAKAVARAHAASPAPPATRPVHTANPIPQGNGGDHDSDNNGAPSDGDGNM